MSKTYRHTQTEDRQARRALAGRARDLHVPTHAVDLDYAGPGGDFARYIAAMAEADRRADARDGG